MVWRCASNTLYFMASCGYGHGAQEQFHSQHSGCVDNDNDSKNMKYIPVINLLLRQLSSWMPLSIPRTVHFSCSGAHLWSRGNSHTGRPYQSRHIKRKNKQIIYPVNYLTWKGEQMLRSGTSYFHYPWKSAVYIASLNRIRKMWNGWTLHWDCSHIVMTG